VTNQRLISLRQAQRTTALAGQQTHPRQCAAGQDRPSGNYCKTERTRSADHLRRSSHFVQVPVTVKNKDGRLVDGLLSTDFKVIRTAGAEAELFHRRSDGSFGGNRDRIRVCRILTCMTNQTEPSLRWSPAFAPYDEVAVYTYSRHREPSHRLHGSHEELTRILTQMKTEARELRWSTGFSADRWRRTDYHTAFLWEVRPKPVYTPSRNRTC